MKTHILKKRRGFSIVELLVVIGILAMLMTLLAPVMARARRQALAVKCMSNMRQVGVVLTLYSNDFDGWLFPVGKWIPSKSSPSAGHYQTFGYDTTSPIPLDQQTRWTELVFQPAERYPAVMICPADQTPADNHSYMLNQHLAKSPQDLMRFHTQGKFRPRDQIILMGEKVTEEPDWYLELDRNNMSEFYRLAELYRHGPERGSNYLFVDMHVTSFAPSASLANAADPWDPFPAATTQPSP